MTKKQLQLGILFFTIFIDMMGFGIVIPILPRYAEDLGASSWQIGFIVGVFSLAQLVMLPFWGGLSDRIGRKPVLMISVFGTVIGYLIMGCTGSILMMIVGRAIDGAAGGNMAIVQAYLSDITKPEERSQGMGLLGAAYGIGFISGPALGGWASHCYGASVAMLIAAGFALLNFLFILFFLPKAPQTSLPEQAAAKRPPLFLILQHVNKRVYFSVIGTFFCMITGFSIMTTLITLFVYHRYQMNEQQTGYIYAMWGVIAIVVEGGLFGFFAKHFKDRWMVISGAVSMMLAFFLLPFAHEVFFALFLFGMMALGDSLMTPALPAIISRSADPAWHGAALGFYQSAGSLARFVGPLIAGIFLAVDLHGPQSHYAQTACWIASLFLLLAFVCSLKIPSQNSHDRPH